MYQGGPAPAGTKMSVMSVEPPARGAPGGIAAERVHRPGSRRRLGGVEATGASPGVAPSRPHRSGPRAGPVRRTPCARGAWGGERAGGLGLRLACVAQIRRRAGFVLRRVEARARLPEVLSAEADGEKGYQIAPPAMLLEQVGRMAQKIGKCVLEPPTASPRRSDRANASGTGAEAFSAMKLRPFPARISETVRNIDRAR